MTALNAGRDTPAVSTAGNSQGFAGGLTSFENSGSQQCCAFGAQTAVTLKTSFATEYQPRASPLISRRKTAGYEKPGVTSQIFVNDGTEINRTISIPGSDG
jgi:hypothetical protein